MKQLDPHVVNPWAVDSLKIRIPLNRVKVLDESIRGMVSKVMPATESKEQGRQFYDLDGVLYNVLEETVNTKASRDENGIKTVFSIEQRATQHRTVQYLIILINAKQLGARYFEGITASNVLELHGYLMGLEVVVFSLKELLKGECTDIDFRKDFEAGEEQMKEALNHMHQQATPSTDYDKGSKLFWKKDNKGLQFNKRTTTKIKTAPFLKVYSKSLDLLHKSNVFALAHFDTIPQNLWRLEFTIKNKKHLDSFGIGNKLGDVLSIPADSIEAMCTKSLKAVLTPNKKLDPQVEDKTTIPPRDVFEVNGLIMLLDTGMQWHNVKQGILGRSTGSVRSKKLKRLEYLHGSYIRPIERFNSAHAVDDLLKLIGYAF